MSLSDEDALVLKVMDRFKAEASEGSALLECDRGWQLRTPSGRVIVFDEGTRIQALGAALAAAKGMGVIRGE